ncbi:chemotaxis protein CheD [Thioclava sp. SK-1]|uniref:chemotaxis protein CheD n=1 Tax=Thioclava sp. SK-1 TaxID=1889770 RepID=UPI002101A4BF|nr:chemotaxis protein CheD [Thioclava sp. SK-1]
MPRPKHISQGEYATGGADSTSIATILGSCVATCMYDEVAQVGGMNHFLLPDSSGGLAHTASFGVNAMELLINDLVKMGARRDRLKAKVFGGGRMIAGLSDVGQKNGAFILDFLSKEGIPCVGQSLGGTQARRVEFWPSTGRARQKLLGEAQLPEEVRPPPKPIANDVELF